MVVTINWWSFIEYCFSKCYQFAELLHITKCPQTINCNLLVASSFAATLPLMCCIICTFLFIDIATKISFLYRFLMDCLWHFIISENLVARTPTIQNNKCITRGDYSWLHIVLSDHEWDCLISSILSISSTCPTQIVLLIQRGWLLRRQLPFKLKMIMIFWT